MKPPRGFIQASCVYVSMFSAFLHYKSVEAQPWSSDKSSKLQTRLTIRTLGTSSGIRTASGSIGRDEKNENWNYQQFFNLTVLSCPLSTIRPTQLRTHGHRTHVRTESCSFVAHQSSSSDQDPRKMVACRARVGQTATPSQSQKARFRFLTAIIWVVLSCSAKLRSRRLWCS